MRWPLQRVFVHITHPTFCMICLRRYSHTNKAKHMTTTKSICTYHPSCFSYLLTPLQPCTQGQAHGNRNILTITIILVVPTSAIRDWLLRMADFSSSSFAICSCMKASAFASSSTSSSSSSSSSSMISPVLSRKLGSSNHCCQHFAQSTYSIFLRERIVSCVKVDRGTITTDPLVNH